MEVTCSPSVLQRKTGPGRGRPGVSSTTAFASGCHDGRFATSACTLQTVWSGDVARTVARRLGHASSAARARGIGRVAPAQPAGTASAGFVCQLVTTGLSTTMFPTGSETGWGSPSLTEAMTVLYSVPLSSFVVLGFTPA